jgi:PleD family two-component response regulator
MHGGAIGFASKAGVGSTFAFYVKCRKSTVSRRQSDTNTAAVGQSIRTNSSVLLTNRVRKDKDRAFEQIVKGEIVFADLHVLIVEDNLVNQRVLAKQLRNIGMEVTVANHGGEALEHLRNTNYCNTDGAHAKHLSLILMDWEMPV